MQNHIVYIYICVPKFWWPRKGIQKKRTEIISGNDGLKDQGVDIFSLFDFVEKRKTKSAWDHFFGAIRCLNTSQLWTKHSKYTRIVYKQYIIITERHSKDINPDSIGVKHSLVLGGGGGGIFTMPLFCFDLLIGQKNFFF